MLILIGIVPFHFALDHSKDPSGITRSLVKVEQVINRIDTTVLSVRDVDNVKHIRAEIADLKGIFSTVTSLQELPDNRKFQVRKDILLLNKETEALLKSEDLALSLADRKQVEDNIKEMRTYTDYAPFWVIMIVALSLGIGTMIGWKRIVKTIGEKIGKEHLTYAQGASAELMAAGVIGFSTFVFKLPVSTTHILSSGIAGSMVANRGVKNLNPSTIRNIALAWVLTLPVSMFLAGVLFLFFRWLI
jgi:PiT family inorganic phosphate transporter